MKSAFPAVYTTLAGGTRAPAQARNEVAHACHGWSTSTIDTAKLLVSELVTNAVVHGAGDIDLAIARVPALLRVEVTDAGTNPVLPLRETHADDEYGRGLHIVAALATAWGSRPGIVSDDHVSGGKMVWFELRPDAPDIDVAPTATDDNSLRLPRQRAHGNATAACPSTLVQRSRTINGRRLNAASRPARQATSDCVTSGNRSPGARPSGPVTDSARSRERDKVG